MASSSSPFGLGLTTINTALLRPVIALNIWTFVMEAWMYATRIPAINNNKIKLSPESTSADMNARIPPSVRWKADNYNHLMEQPTQFYAVALTLALLGDTDESSVQLAWAYVAVRVVHSLVQASSNVIMVRFGVFATSSVVLLALTVKAAGVLFF